MYCLVLNTDSKLWTCDLTRLIWPNRLLFNQDSCCLYFHVNQIFVKVNSDHSNKVKSVTVAEIYTTKTSHGLFLLAVYENLLFIKNCIAMNPKIY